jgi:hypothetical protein
LSDYKDNVSGFVRLGEAELMTKAPLLLKVCSSRNGPWWEHMVQTRSVGMYIPEDIPSPEVEVHVVLENS